MRRLKDYLDLIKEESVERLRDIQDLVEWEMERRATVQTDVRIVPPSAKITLSATPPVVTTSNGTETRIVKRGGGSAFDMYVHALRVLGGQGTAEEIYTKLLELGYTLTAANPPQAVKTYLRQPGKFKRVGTTAEGKGIWALPDDYRPQEAAEQPELAGIDTGNEK